MFSRPDIHVFLQKASSFFNVMMDHYLKHDSSPIFSNILLFCITVYAQRGGDKKYKQEFDLFSRLREPYPAFFHELDLFLSMNNGLSEESFVDEVREHIVNLNLLPVDYNFGVNAFVIPLVNGYIFKQIHLLHDFVKDIEMEDNVYASVIQRLDILLSGNFILEEFLLLPAPFNDLCSKSDTFSPNKFLLNVLGHYLGDLTDIAEESEMGTKTNPYFSIQHYGGGLNKNCKCNGTFLSCCSISSVGNGNEIEKCGGGTAVIDIISHLHFLNITEICNLKHLEKCVDEYFFNGFKNNLKIRMNQSINFFFKIEDYVDEGLLLLNLYHILHGSYYNNDFDFRRRVENFCSNSKVKSLESRFALIKQSKPFDDFDAMSKRVHEVKNTWSFNTLQNLMNVEMHHPILNACQMMHSFVIHFIPETNNPKFVGVYDVNKFVKLFCLDYRTNGFEYSSVEQEPIDLKGDGTKYVYVKDMSFASSTIDGVIYITLGKHLMSFLTASLRKTLQNENVTIASTCRTIKIGKRQKWLVSVGVSANQEHHVDLTIYNDGKEEIIQHQIKTTNLSNLEYNEPFTNDFGPLVIFYPFKSSKLYLVEDRSKINLFVGGNGIFDVTPNGLHVALYLVRFDDIFEVIYSLNITTVLKDKLKRIEFSLMEDENEMEKGETEKKMKKGIIEREWEELKVAGRGNAGIMKKNGLYPMKYNDRRDELKNVLFSSNYLNREDAEDCYKHLMTFYHPSLYDEEKYHGKKKICYKKDATYVSSCKLPQREKKNCCRYVSIINDLLHRDKTVIKCKAVQTEKKNDNNVENLKNDDEKYDSFLKQLLTTSNMGKYRCVVEKINHAIQFYEGPISATTGFPSLSSLNLSEIPMLNLRGKTLQNVIDMPEDMSSGSKLFYKLCVNNTPRFRKINISCIREKASNLQSFVSLNLLYQPVSDFDGVLRFKIKNALVIKDDIPIFASFVKKKGE